MLEKDPVSGKYIMRVDASLYKETDCLRFVWYKLIKGLTTGHTGVKNPVTEYGTAFHKGLQLRAEGASVEEQLKVVTTHFGQPEIAFSDKEWRTMGHLVNTYVAYDMTYKIFDQLKPVVRNGITLVEQRFMFPFYKTDRVEVLLCGTIDLIAEYMGQLVVADHKTTSAWNVEEYLGEYDLSPQLMIYKWIYDTLNGTDCGAIINGIFIGSRKPAVFKRSDLIRFSPTHVENCISNLRDKVVTIVKSFEHYLDTNSNALFTANYCQCVRRFGEKSSPCTFKPLCQQLTDEDAECMTNSLFEAKVYDPMQWQL